MIKIELAKTSDLDGVMKVIKACSADLISKKIFQWSEKYPSSEVFKNDIDKNTLFVAKHKSKIIGCVALCSNKDLEYKNVKWLTEDNKNLYIHRLAVDPNFQKKGIGKSLMDFAEEYAKKISLRLSDLILLVRIKGIINSINQENILSLVTFFFQCKVNIHFIAMKKLY